jgi:radical SAM protein with 4Fe4S-binding SPASM domain
MACDYPYFVDWVITSKCNLSCWHCRGMTEGELSLNRAKKLLEEIAELKPGWLIIEGGEPLLRKDIFILLERAKKLRLETYLITNGMLLSQETIARLKALSIKIMVSIDGASKATYESIRNGASYEQVLDAAKRCCQDGILTAINFTVLRRNYQEIPAVMEMAASLDHIKVNFIGLKPCHNYQEELLTAGEYEEAIRLTCEAAQKYGVAFFFDEPFFWPAVRKWKLEVAPPRGGAGIVEPRNSSCIFGRYLFIEPNGDVKPCSFAPYVLGNIVNIPLDSVWREALDLPLLKNTASLSQTTGVCKTCAYLSECHGCRSRAFALTGSWYSSDPACPLQSVRKDVA